MWSPARLVHCTWVTSLLVGYALAESAWSTCSDHHDLKIDSFSLDPPYPQPKHQVTATVKGSVLESAPEAGFSPEMLRVTAEVVRCRRINDCMVLWREEKSFCDLMKGHNACSRHLDRGSSFLLQHTFQLPSEVLRGSYDVHLALHHSGKLPQAHACEWMHGIGVMAYRPMNIFFDYRDAVIAFLVASSSSKAIGRLFPEYSRGVLPQISGFLCMGIVVGPYCANLVSHFHIHLIGGIINRLSLSFIAGAAGSEIFLPELRDLLAPMGLQVILISLSTLLVCTVGFLAVTETGIVAVPALAMQESFGARLAITLLAASLMTARSPASAIAVISELKCGASRIAKIVLGVTVLSDIAVLMLFAICKKIATVATEGGRFGPGALLGVSVGLVASGLLGVVTGQVMRLVIIPEGKSAADSEEKASGSTWVSDDLHHALRGLLLLSILYAAFLSSENMGEWTAAWPIPLHIEPLLACTVASSVCGHDVQRRHLLEESLAFWAPVVLLPFFTLAGASLELPGVGAVFPAALALAVFRMAGIACGSMVSGVLSARIWQRTSGAEIRYTWLTLLAQAGVTLGLVLEVQKEFKGWGEAFATLVIGTVVLNQLLGPVLCRVGLTWIVEEAQKSSEVCLPEEALPLAFYDVAATQGDSVSKIASKANLIHIA
eukprot:TRINITY_DN24105_c0_g2_i1.p1 TRINITY_DN24105_c0_g2~~TRINITY_DN24105_c0_g2_i1.p1  ORF type:complete len:679 (-),score=105.73 TRINITY_DN24105_c0_g2_i1:84-2069(-)